jgi:hypothetical protein
MNKTLIILTLALSACASDRERAEREGWSYDDMDHVRARAKAQHLSNALSRFSDSVRTRQDYKPSYNQQTNCVVIGNTVTCN